VASGGTLLSTLGNQKVFLPSACGGGGTCIQCECHVNSGGGEGPSNRNTSFL
jgi:Na+-transporting NADH:ubiquinone oxidoreductase subunit F